MEKICSRFSTKAQKAIFQQHNLDGPKMWCLKFTLHYFFLVFVCSAYVTKQQIRPNSLPSPASKLSTVLQQTSKFDERSTTRFLHRIICGKTKVKYTIPQIEEFISTFRVPVNHPDEESGLLPLRLAIRSGNADLVKLMLRFGASPEGIDKDGEILREVRDSRSAGALKLLTLLLENTANHDAVIALLETKPCTKYSIQYWTRRSRWNTFPADKLTALGIPRLNALKYRVVGQKFAIESVSDYSAYTCHHR